MYVSVTSPFEEVVQRKDWQPTQKQQKFIELPFEVFEAGYGGALGSGKTELLLLLPLIYRFYEHAKFRGLMVRRTFPELEQEVIQRSKEFYPSTGAVYNEAKRWWKFPRGGYDRFGHIEHDKDVKKYDGAQYNIERWDEATSHTQFQYEYLVLRRCRSGTSDLPAISRWGSNPGGIGHTYFRKRFIDPYKAGGKILREKNTGTLKFFLPATGADNKHLLENNPNYYQRLQGISSEAERRAMILGDWYTFEGQVFEEFRLEPLPGEPDNARHVIEPFNIPSFWPKIIAIDWGYAAWNYAIWFAISPHGRVYIYRTYAVKKTKIKDWTRQISLLSGDEIPNIRDVRLCHSANQDRGQDQTIEQQVAEAFEDAGFSCGVTLGERNRIAGKQLVHEYLRWQQLPPIKAVIGEYSVELANKIYRQHGEEGLKEYNKLFEEPEDEILPKLQIFSTSPEGRSSDDLQEAISTCIYDETRKEDVKEFDGDDPYDCLRIGLFAIRDYFDEAKDEFKRQKKYASAQKVITATEEEVALINDPRLREKKLAEAQTAYYRSCEVIEAASKEVYAVRKKGFRFRR